MSADPDETVLVRVRGGFCLPGARRFRGCLPRRCRGRGAAEIMSVSVKIHCLLLRLQRVLSLRCFSPQVVFHLHFSFRCFAHAGAVLFIFNSADAVRSSETFLFLLVYSRSCSFFSHFHAFLLSPSSLPPFFLLSPSLLPPLSFPSSSLFLTLGSCRWFSLTASLGLIICIQINYLITARCPAASPHCGSSALSL